jgi:hypothetical protein
VAVVSGADGSVLRTYALPDVDNGDDTSGNPVDGRPSGFGNAVANLPDIGGCMDNPAPAPGAPCATSRAWGTLRHHFGDRRRSR